MGEVTLADVDQAEARLADIKQQREKGGITEHEYIDAKREIVNIRRTWREQETAAGRRSAGIGIGGDAVPSEG